MFSSDPLFDADAALDFAISLALVNSRVTVANFSYYQGPDAVFFECLEIAMVVKP